MPTYPRPNIPPVRALRCAIVLERSHVPAWQAQCVAALRDCPGVSVALVCAAKAPFPRRPFAPRSGTLRTIEVAGVAELPDHKELEASDVDFILDLSGALSVSNATLAPLGVWSFQTPARGPLDRFIGWREFAAGSRTLDIALISDCGGKRPRVLRSGRFNISLRMRSLEPILEMCARWPAWCAQEFSAKSAVEMAPSWEPRCEIPLRTFVTAPLRLVSRLWQRLCGEIDWNIGVIENATPEQFLTTGYRPAVRWLRWNEAHPFIADPMVASHAGKAFVLCESLDRRANRGQIDAFEISGSVAMNQQCVMRQDSHLSYPFLFEYADSYYCVPETAEKNCVQLYRATAFPYQWSFVGTLIEDFDACDSTLFRYNDRWWLLCTSKSANPNIHLFAFHADSLMGPWKPHARNPIKSDISSARPAGKPFFHEGGLYRPAQDCSLSWGGALCINRIVELTPSEFHEEIVTTLLPHHLHPYTAGVHTLSWDKGICVIDGKRCYFSLKRLARVLRLSPAPSFQRTPSPVTQPIFEAKREAAR